MSETHQGIILADSSLSILKPQLDYYYRFSVIARCLASCGEGNENNKFAPTLINRSSRGADGGTMNLGHLAVAVDVDDLVSKL